jgi:hypothetical protein
VPPANAFPKSINKTKKNNDDTGGEMDATTNTNTKTNNKNTSSDGGGTLRQRKSTEASSSSSSAAAAATTKISKDKKKDDLVANSAVPAAYSRANLASTRIGGSLPSSSSSSSDYVDTSSSTSPQATTAYWLRYWYTYAVVHAIGLFCSMVPIVGRIVTRYPIFYLATGEIKLMFFIWLYGMEYVLRNTARDAFLAEALPLTLMKRHVTPILLEMHEKVSEAVSEATWQKYVVSKTKGTLEVFVMVRMISDRRKDWIVHVMEEARVLVVPSVTLLMPGLITQFGVLYVQYIVPSAKSAQARSDSAKLVYLQYWILNCFATGMLTWFSNVLWWVPFSTHLIYLLWCYLVIPQHIRDKYEILEGELIAFGILRGNGGSVVRVSETKTAQLFNALSSRLPSASSNVNYDEEKKEQQVETPVVGSKNDTSLAKKSEDGEESLPDLAAKTSSTHDESDAIEGDETSQTTKKDSLRRSNRNSVAKHSKVE